jgi:N-acetylglucosaminyldiphosphoundecaprenol N-acetyl-beta-D-mannosaminyltransferase
MSYVSNSKVRMLGGSMDLLTSSELNTLIAQAIEQRRRWIIANHNLHSLYLIQGKPELHRFFQLADFIHIDGMPLVALARMLGFPASREHRTTYVDWFPQIISAANRNGWRVFYLGSRPGVAEKGFAIMRQEYPSLSVQVHHGFFDPQVAEHNDTVLAAINAFAPHIVFVGMGMPRQELWLLHNIEKLSANVFLPCGACIDYVAGEVAVPPRWSGPLGLEWAFRLLADPRRLARRYLLEPWVLLPRFVGELVGTWIGRSRE